MLSLPKRWSLRSLQIWLLAVFIQPCTSFSRPSLALTRLAGEPSQDQPGNWAPALVDQQWVEWKASHPRLCSVFTHICLYNISPPSNRLAIITAQDMRENMLGIGSCWFVPLVLLCTAFGVWRPGLPPAASSSAFRLDKLTAWWHRGPRLSAISLKVCVCTLLLIELLGLTAPMLAVLSLPDTLRRVRRHPYGPAEELGLLEGHSLAETPHLMPRLTYLFMPDLDDSTADGYASFHAGLLATMLFAWCIFLAAPCTWRRTCTACYTWGAAMYFYSGSLGMMFAPTTSVCCSYFFVVGAAFVVADAEDASAQAWLWKFLVMSILAPYYLAAGFAKLRYLGWMSVLTGSWMRKALDAASFFPGFNAWAKTTPWMTALLSCGWMLVEFVGPLLVLAIDVGKPCSKVVRWTLTLWSSLVVCFVLGTFAFLSPNFVRHLPLAMLMLHGLWCSDGSESQVRPDAHGAPPLVYHCRVILAMLMLTPWFAVELWSDLAHLTGATPQLARHDPGWPTGELVMFVHPSETSNYARSLLLQMLVICGLCTKKSRDVWSATKTSA
ncbi:unnamed protein product [Symbiodinium sp. CCMP2592]|nr:unnamed protein product [Symbiodinium sp. CCMP2592]